MPDGLEMWLSGRTLPSICERKREKVRSENEAQSGRVCLSPVLFCLCLFRVLNVSVFECHFFPSFGKQSAKIVLNVSCAFSLHLISFFFQHRFQVWCLLLFILNVVVMVISLLSGYNHCLALSLFIDSLSSTQFVVILSLALFIRSIALLISWRNGSCCSSRGFTFSSQHLYGSLQLSVVLVPRNNVFWSPQALGIHMIFTNTCRPDTIKINKTV